MKVTFPAAIIAATLLTPIGDARGADGAICASDPVVIGTNAQSSPVVMVTPTPSNNTLYRCASPNGYTFKQLSQAGWIIDNVHTVVVRSSTNSATGYVQNTWRHFLTIQK